MPLVLPDEIRRLSVPSTLPGAGDEDWVEISIVYTSALRKKLANRAVSLGDDGEGRVNMFEYRQALLENIVKSWSDPTPVSPDALGMLHPDVVDWIVTEYDRLSSGRTEDEKKGLKRKSTPSLQPVSTSRSNSHI